MRCQPCMETWFMTCSSAELVPVAHARACPTGSAGRSGGASGNASSRYSPITVVWRDDHAVVIEHRDLAFGVDRDEPGLVLLELVQVDIDTFECQPAFP